MPITDHAAWLKGGETRCDTPPATPARVWRLVLLGAPGVGKGTQAQLLHGRLGACHLSTGDIFRAAKTCGNGECTPAMAAALEHMKRGELVPDETVLAIVRERAGCLQCRGGFLLDGFPRTVAQAEALQRTLAELDVKLDGVLSYNLAREEVVARISGRRVCPSCKATYHVSGLRTRREGICDLCGGALTQREDDRPDSVRVRLEAYEKNTAPLAQYYRRLGLLISVEVGAFPEVTFERTLMALESRR